MKKEVLFRVSSAKRLKVLNAIVCPREGKWEIYAISEREFASILRLHSELGFPVKSYIGYEQTRAQIQGISGVEVELCRDQMDPQKDDAFLVCKLKYRLPDPSKKGQEIQNPEWDYYVMFFEPHEERG